MEFHDPLTPVSYTHLKDELNTAYELYKKNQYGKYLKDVMDGKFIDQ